MSPVSLHKRSSKLKIQSYARLLLAATSFSELTIARSRPFVAYLCVAALGIVSGCAPDYDRYNAAREDANAKMEEFRNCMELPDGSPREGVPVRVQDMKHPCAEEMRVLDAAIERARFEGKLLRE